MIDARIHLPPDWCQTALAAMKTAVITTDINGRISFLNVIAEEMSGWSLRDANGIPLAMVLNIVDGKTRQPIVNRLDSVLRHGAPADLPSEIILISKEARERLILVSAVPIRDASCHVVGCGLIWRESSDKMRVEKQLSTAQQALDQADRGKNEFIAALAHQLRGPLHGLSCTLGLMQLKKFDPISTQKYLRIMEQDLGAVKRLVADLFDLGRISFQKLELKKEFIELSSVIQKMVESFKQSLTETNRDFSVTLSSESLYLDADPVRLPQIFLNLLHNAVKCTDQGGTISLIAERQGDDAVVKIRNNGVGIATEKLQTAFDFSLASAATSDRSPGGREVGLALVRLLVEMHGGTVQVTSEGINMGCEFTVRLPLSTNFH